MSTIQTTQPAAIGANGTPIIPPLEQGDHLTREEFHRRYEAMPHIKKAELIEGVVHLPSPVRFEQHSSPQFYTNFWLGCYVMATPGLRGGGEATLKLDLKNEPQPDGFLFVPRERGGRVKIDEDGYIVGGPELIDEIAESSASYDLHSKFEAYRRNRVQEYIVWRVLDNAIDWFVLENDQYVRLPCESGIYRSRVFPGLWLDVQALIEGNLTKVSEVVQQGIATQEHQKFVASLQSAKP